MNRTLSVERLYQLGDFRNIKLGDSFIELPVEIAMDRDLVSKFRMLQLIDTELAYRRYLKLTELSQSKTMTFEEIQEELEDMRVSLFSEIKDLLNGETEDQKVEDVKES